LQIVDDEYDERLMSIIYDLPLGGDPSKYELCAAVKLFDSGSTQAGVPSLFGMNFQSVSTAEKLTESGSQPGGYRPDEQSPGPVLASALGFVDTQIGRMVEGAHNFLRLPEPPERDARRQALVDLRAELGHPVSDRR
jgi:hypothetical protein